MVAQSSKDECFVREGEGEGKGEGERGRRRGGERESEHQNLHPFHGLTLEVPFLSYSVGQISQKPTRIQG